MLSSKKHSKLEALKVNITGVNIFLVAYFIKTGHK